MYFLTLVKIKFADWLSIMRKQQGHTQGVIAERLGVRIQTVGNWERGITTPSLNPEQFGAYCSLLGVSLEQFVKVYKQGADLGDD